jgi:hypothetical protein
MADASTPGPEEQVRSLHEHAESHTAHAFGQRGDVRRIEQTCWW